MSSPEAMDEERASSLPSWPKDPVPFWPGLPPNGHSPYHEHPEGEDVEAGDRLQDQAGQQDPLPAQHNEQQDCCHQIDRPLYRRCERQENREPIGQRGYCEGKGQPSLREAWAGQKLGFLAMEDWCFRRQNLDWRLCTYG